MTGLRFFMAAVSALAALIAPPLAAQEAHFTIRSEVVNPNLPAFAATIAEFGNGAEFIKGGSGFEPAVFRDRISATADSPNTIIASAADITRYDSFPEGMLDGAEVEVLRILNGSLQTVRLDRVAKGGHHASGWMSLIPQGKILPADMTSMTLAWDGFNRLDVPWFFTVRAVDADGRLSAPAPTLAVMPPAKPGKVTDEIGWLSMEVRSELSNRQEAPGPLVAKKTFSGTVLLSWDPVPGAVGYIVFRSATPPETHRGYGLVLEGTGTSIRAGDMILLRKKFYAPTRAEVATHRIWKAFAPADGFGIPFLERMPGDPGVPPMRLVAHGDHPQIPDAGETYLQVDLKQGQSLLLGKYNFSSLAEGYYPKLKTGQLYRFEVWLRGRGHVGAKFSLSGVYRSVPGLPVTVPIGPDWKRHIVEFRPPPSDTQNKQVGMMKLQLSGVGQVDVDNIRLYQADADFMDLHPEDRMALMDAGLSFLRTHMFIKSGVSSYDLDQFTAPAGASRRMWGHSLPQILRILRDLDIDPWLQIELHLSKEEWLGLVEYLAAPYDPLKDDPKALPWAARRAAQGHPAPWIDDFNTIRFELSNETWNRLFAPWNFPPMTDAGLGNSTAYTSGEVYGLYQEHVLSILRESPWWDRLAPKLEPVIGGWMVRNYGVDALARSPNSKVLTNPAYIGGWDSGEGAVRATPEGFASVMAFAPQRMADDTTRFHADVAARAPGREVVLGSYESGPGYAKDGLNNDKVSPERAAEQERVMKSAAAGAATLDNFMMRATLGDQVQNFFTFGRGDKWNSHARWNAGGQSYPSWDWLTLFNRLGTGGDVLMVETDAVPTRDLAETPHRKALDDAPMAAAYAVRRGKDLVVVVVSRLVPGLPSDAAGDISVRLDLPITGAKQLIRYHATGDFRSENTTAEQSRIISETMPLPQDPARLDIAALAPASAEIYVFKEARFSP